MSQKPTASELHNRIQQDIDHYRGKLPESFAIAWSGYLAALIEWGLISNSEHQDLCTMLPEVREYSSVTILLGREGQSSNL
ncbi:MAG: hypothetical protein Tsb009_17080 [Planctomycetaceae bacterium]